MSIQNTTRHLQTEATEKHTSDQRRLHPTNGDYICLCLPAHACVCQWCHAKNTSNKKKPQCQAAKSELAFPQLLSAPLLSTCGESKACTSERDIGLVSFVAVALLRHRQCHHHCWLCWLCHSRRWAQCEPTQRFRGRRPLPRHKSTAKPPHMGSEPANSQGRPMWPACPAAVVLPPVCGGGGAPVCGGG